MGPALHGVDVVHEREDRFRVPVVPLEGGLDLRAVVLLREVDWRVVEGRLRAVDPRHVFRDPSLELEHVSLPVRGVRDHDPEALVQERELSEAGREGLEVERDGLEDLRVGLERDHGARAVRGPDLLQVGFLLPAGEPDAPFLPVPLDAGLEPLAQAVHDESAG